MLGNFLDELIPAAQGPEMGDRVLRPELSREVTLSPQILISSLETAFVGVVLANNGNLRFPAVLYLDVHI